MKQLVSAALGSAPTFRECLTFDAANIINLFGIKAQKVWKVITLIPYYKPIGLTLVLPDLCQPHIFTHKGAYFLVAKIRQNY